MEQRSFVIPNATKFVGDYIVFVRLFILPGTVSGFPVTDAQLRSDMHVKHFGDSAVAVPALYIRRMLLLLL